MVEGVLGKVMAVRLVAMVVEEMIGSKGDSVPSSWWPFLSHHCSLECRYIQWRWQLQRSFRYSLGWRRYGVGALVVVVILVGDEMAIGISCLDATVPITVAWGRKVVLKENYHQKGVQRGIENEKNFD